jgi:predicted kinase
MSRRPHPPGPGAIVVAGPPGSGKTTLATGLAAALGWMIVDLDVVTGALTRTALDLAGAAESAIDGAPGRRIRAARYEALLAVASANLAIGAGVVLAAPFSAELADARRWETVARPLRAAGSGDDPVLVYVDCPPDLRWERLRSRAAARDRVKLAHPPAVSRPAADVPAIVINATRPLAEQVSAVLATIGDPLAAVSDPSPC